MLQKEILSGIVINCQSLWLAHRKQCRNFSSVWCTYERLHQVCLWRVQNWAETRNLCLSPENKNSTHNEKSRLPHVLQSTSHQLTIWPLVFKLKRVKMQRLLVSDCNISLGFLFLHGNATMNPALTLCQRFHQCVSPDFNFCWTRRNNDVLLLLSTHVLWLIATIEQQALQKWDTNS